MECLLNFPDYLKLKSWHENVLRNLHGIEIAVANRKSLFDDKPVEIQELTYIVKQDIGSLNKQIAQLQEVRIHDM